MILVKNYFIPIPGFRCLTIWPFIFMRKMSGVRGEFSELDRLHEGVHGEQQKELLVVLFFVIYLLDWLIRLIIYRDALEAYRNISFEQEAFLYQRDPDYLSRRKRYAWVKYITRKTYKR